MISINDLFANANKEFVKVEEGTFKSKIVEIKESTSKKGKPMVQITFEVVEGDKKSGRFNHFMSLGTDKGKEISARILCQIALNIYSIAQSKLEEDAETVDDLITNVVAEVGKKIKKSDATMNVTRTANGDFYNNKIDTNATKTADDFFAEVQNA